ncbi:amino acid permease/ SLC12A domain-containing protein [Dimargaris cristalligena]|uniref:Amino acid permease/ SLC12A domain-containing protein n=1 Tax=Dimargaris cristalligena TaxID=215637 RepID=A0A4P9ZUX5_9FUNG|nr:amino acid permease/ SLC12A domain-containing protein [Dimargaris cristalligena]|eukprot:RKP36410.1 amino acid permease/ SLC12A domain-containing protein [Dimargaris cristalligena]
MIAIGGTIGTGLFIGSGTALADAGPAGCLMAYLLVGIMVFFVMSSLGELATYIPVPGSFNTYGGRFIDPAFGFALGWNYWFSWTVTVASELVATGIIIQFWLPHVTGIIWSAIAMIIMFALNAFSVKGYGESEYWFSLIKVVAVVVFIIVGVFTDAGVIGGYKYGFENWTRPEGPFNDGAVGIIKSFLVAGFSFQGTELVGVAAGESENPRRDVPRAIRQVFWRILIFYILATFVMGLIIPYDEPLLVKAESVGDVGISPFTLVFQKSGMKPAAHIMNAVILITVLSAGNSGLYCCARTLWTLSMEGKAPAFLRKVSKNGIPVNCLLVTTAVSTLFFSLSFIGNKVVYGWLVNISGITGFMAWLGIAVSHWRFRRAYVAQGYDVGALPYRALWFPVGPIIAVLITSFVILGQGYPSFSNGFDAATFFSSYLGLPIFISLFVVWRVLKRTRLIPLVDVDVVSDTRVFDDIVMTEVVESH